MKKALTLSIALISALFISFIILLSYKSAFSSEATANLPRAQQKIEKQTQAIIDTQTIDTQYIEKKHYLPPSPTVTAATIGSVGDILIHDRVYNKASIGGGHYNFNPMLAPVKADLEKPNIMIANSESKIGGVAYGLSSYPSFNSPVEIGDTLKADGVDLVTMANNHALDRGEKTIISAIKHWDQIGMLHTGAFLSEADRNHIQSITVNNIKFAFLAYTYGTNGIPLPKDKPYLVNIINPALMKKDITEAKKQADVVVLCLHFGTEYQRMPNKQQIALVKTLANDGADIIFGSHPHVLQPVSWIKRSDGKRTFVAYSLGNFISGQYGDYKDLGGIVNLKVEKTVKDGEVTIQLDQPSFIPTYVDRNYVVHPLSTLPNKQSIYQSITQHMKQWMPELTFPKT